MIDTRTDSIGQGDEKSDEKLFGANDDISIVR